MDICGYDRVNVGQFFLLFSLLMLWGMNGAVGHIDGASLDRSAVYHWKMDSALFNEAKISLENRQ